MISADQGDQLDDGEETTDLSETNEKSEGCSCVNSLIFFKIKEHLGIVIRNHNFIKLYPLYLWD